MRLLKRLQWTEPDDTWLAARFRAAGLVFVGKTNTPELATSVTTEPIAYGPDAQSVGPHALAGRIERWLGGRGRGGHGADRARQRHGRLDPFPGVDVRHRRPQADPRAASTLGPDFGEYWGPLTHEHVLTRSVRDTAARARRGRGPRARRSVQRAATGATVRRTRSARRPGRLRIGLRTRRRDGESVASRVSARGRTRRAAARIARASRGDASTCPRSTQPVDGAFGIVMTVAIARDLERWAARPAPRSPTTTSSPATCFLARDGRRASTRSRTPARSRGCKRGRAGVAAWWNDHDLLVTPTSPELPVRLGELAPTNPDPAVMTRMGTLDDVHDPVRRDRPAGDLAAAALDRRRPPGRRATRRRLRARRRAPAGERAARSRVAVGATCTRHPRRNDQRVDDQRVTIEASAQTATINPISMYVTVRASGACARSVELSVRPRGRDATSLRRRTSARPLARNSAAAQREHELAHDLVVEAHAAQVTAARSTDVPGATPGEPLRCRDSGRPAVATDRSRPRSSTSPGVRTTRWLQRDPVARAGTIGLDSELGEPTAARREHAGSTARPRPAIVDVRRRDDVVRADDTATRSTSDAGSARPAPTRVHASAGAGQVAVVDAFAPVDRHRRSGEQHVQRRIAALAHRLAQHLAAGQRPREVVGDRPAPLLARRIERDRGRWPHRVAAAIAGTGPARTTPTVAQHHRRRRSRTRPPPRRRSNAASHRRQPTARRTGTSAHRTTCETARHAVARRALFGRLRGPARRAPRSRHSAVLLKADGSIAVHSDSKAYKPLNWMSPPCTIVRAGRRHRRDEPQGRDAARSRSTKCCTTPRSSSATIPGLEKDGVEAELQQLLAARVAALRDDFVLVRREFPTDIGPIDLLCRDGDGPGGRRGGEARRRDRRGRATPALSGAPRPRSASPRPRPACSSPSRSSRRPASTRRARASACVEIDLARLRGDVDPDLKLF